jgi:UDP-N-acetylmuramoylalanine--D-glutamate ligase
VASDPRLAPGGLAGAEVVVEGTAPDASKLARLLASEGAQVRIVMPAELDLDPRADAAFLDVWTPEVAPRVRGLRATGALVTCLADLVLARARRRTIGITGTAGKTTATCFAVQLLRAAGVDVAAPEPGVSGNLWPDATLLRASTRDEQVVLELTSSHLAFCGSSPRVAVVTSFWPDHIELHGSLESYRHAKEAIARGQRAGDLLVVPADGSCEGFVAASAGDVVRFSASNPVEQGAFVRAGRLVSRWREEERELGDLERLPVRGRLVTSALAAVAAALAVDAAPEALADGLESLTLPPHRLVEVARCGGVPVLDDSMAGTPAKAAAALELYPDDSIVLVAGGELEGAAGRVHATNEEQELLAVACALARQKTRRTVLFGPAADALDALLPGAERAGDLGEALERAVALADGAVAVLLAPMFPLPPGERARVPDLARRAAAARP